MKRRTLECVLVVVIIALAARLFLPGASGSITYFSPGSLQSAYRSNEWQLGVIPIPTSGLTAKPSALTDHLVRLGYWSPSDSPRQRWIVTGSFSSQWKGGASWLHRILFWQDEKWIAWTDANPDLARVVWPAFLASLRREKSQGESIELLFVAERAASVEEFRQSVQESEFFGDELKKLIPEK
jgi:hypothetical protein